MGNYAYFIISNKKGPPETKKDWDAKEEHEYDNLQVLESKNSVPLFWLLLFEKKNMKKYRDPEDGIKLPYLVSKLEKAQLLYSKRKPEIQKMIPNISEFYPAWESFLEKIEKKYVKINIFEVLEMSEDGYDEFPLALELFENFTQKRLDAFFSLTCLGDVIDPKSFELREPNPIKIGDLVKLYPSMSDGIPDEKKISKKEIQRKPLKEYMYGYKLPGWVPWENGEKKWAQRKNG